MSAEFDQYINQATPFAQPILRHLRQLIRAELPEVQEHIKWGHLFFCGKHNLCFMAAFTAHCGFGFWRADDMGLTELGSDKPSAMGQFGRICNIADLPDAKELQRLLQLAWQLDQQGPAAKAKKPRVVTVALPCPEDFNLVLQQNAAALCFYQQLSIAQQNQYLQWIDDAKTAKTRLSRLKDAVLWLSEEKRQDWKYRNC